MVGSIYRAHPEAIQRRSTVISLLVYFGFSGSSGRDKAREYQGQQRMAAYSELGSVVVDEYHFGAGVIPPRAVGEEDAVAVKEARIEYGSGLEA